MFLASFDNWLQMLVGFFFFFACEWEEKNVLSLSLEERQQLEEKYLFGGAFFRGHHAFVVVGSCFATLRRLSPA